MSSPHTRTMNEWLGAVREADGLILRDKALHAGVDPDAIMKALRTGRLRRLQRCIYVLREDEVSPLTIARAAVLASGIPDAVASHQTAARVHEIPIPVGRYPEHVTVPRNQRRLRRKELVFHSREFNIGDVEVLAGVPVTRPARTLVDLTTTLPRTEAVWAVDDALRRDLVTRAEIDQCLTSRPGAPGDAQARTRVAEADGKAESILETAGRLTLADARLPLPVAQFEVRAPGGFVAFLDGAYPEKKVGLEFDGQSVHNAPEALFRDRDRQNRLVALGWTILRYTWWDVTYGKARFIESVRNALQSAA